MSGRRCVLVAAALVLAACSDPSATTTTTDAAVATAPQPSTTTASTTGGTVPTVGSPVDICTDRTAWEPGVAHRATCFVVPLTFTPAESGWRATRAVLDAIEGEWKSETSEVLRFVILVFMPDATPQEALEAILAIDGVEARTPLTADNSIVRVAVDTAPAPGSQIDLDRDGCADSGDVDIRDPAGYVLLDLMSLSGDGGALYGLGACRTFRVWSVRIGGETLTILATTEDLDRFDELMPRMQRLVDTITVATP